MHENAVNWPANGLADRLEWITTSLTGASAWLPSWIVSAILLFLSMIAAELVYRVVIRQLEHLVSGKDLFWRALVTRTGGPIRLGLFIVALSIASHTVSLSPAWVRALQQALLVGFVVLLGWTAMTAVHIWTTLHLRRFKLDAEDNLLARKHVTQTRILRRVMNVLIVIVTVSAALMTIDSVRQYGVSLLASAGAAGLVIGLALQPVLKNLFAGIQLALTQPIRLDDALLVENEWGNVEEITSTYVVVRLWDWRRLVLPLGYFIEKPFQNWTREGAALIGNVIIYLDYTVPLASLRAKAKEIVAGSSLWDGQVFALQVTDFKERTMEVRILVSAGNAGKAFDLRCEVREKLIAFLQNEYPHALPRLRAEMLEAPRGEGRSWQAMSRQDGNREARNV